MTKPAYEALTPRTLPQRLGTLPALTDRVGPPDGWDVTEVGDGNLNLVFIVRGDAGAAVVKQALPYVRLVGESWPLPLKRSFFEYHALIREEARDPGAVPEVFHFDEDQALIVMEYLDRHIILRQGLIQARRYDGLGRMLGRFCARTLFRGSDLSMKAPEKKADVALFCGNVELCDITENLIFSDPYFDAEMNRHTAGLDAAVARLRADLALKVAAQELKLDFTTRAETLLHGDLHTGSVMVADDGDYRVIDPEFAFYGPMGFDIGMLISNFLMAYMSQPGHESEPGDRATYQDWLLAATDDIWSAFAEAFSRLWHEERRGILYQATLYEDQGHHQAADVALARRLDAIWRDALGFCGVEMHRRILGLAHNADFETISDEARRATCEARALALGTAAIHGRDSISDMGALLELARRTGTEDHL
ncbi:5-methylthioribose kinase [Paracoccus isoporae]|uniref:S-methyl-5-thioribose kinase n=1 Tax=Paracoccus isoporae TaxID=591205 RepID=A0A1G7DN14_9RHOB|nr:S-methyl-5-thioribose kinase [Paracoccus isoporae]SDE52520.1 5-methylthioribose kinase [Paracoccus isoporae]